MATLFYLIGPSGSGKDALLQGLRQRLGGRAPLLFAHRYITRDWRAGGENHIALSAEEFAQRLERGLFKLHWQANGCRYALGIELDAWLDSGQSVIANGSRAQLEQARRCFGERLMPVEVRVDPQRLRQRLRARGREDEAAISARLARNARLERERRGQTLQLDNNGDLDAALTRLQRLLLTHLGASADV
ncbi:ribose 1,5-bisphosphokinase [Marichromatium gracile]|uniref:ribose 1,5-bisphosphokinase n=1 Tax=Marichromatium gracile TaxID=1048 RepID=UPI001F2D2199|nr:ribose 1,5-bisphosphokinase [Marichromatium gracile]MCF1182483.1 ribose 1,5-bisphosphokinase [Marichromatium gracile]